MQLIEIFIIALGLAMDAFAVSVSSGVIIHKLHIRHAMRVAAFFGGFQALMPYIGWQIGRLASDYVRAYDHWVAFIILAAIGGKMIYEAKWGDEEKERPDPLSLKVLLILAIATSIDALAVGVTFSCLNMAIVMPVIIIGIVTFITSLAGVYIGDFFGNIFGDKLEIFGGLILIGIGAKILLEHLFFA
ncbi:MAG: manganese efflux pump [Sedimentisphaerales bacterium]|nr:manganese efflux pump [Sedimentisphaerales bacterium]MBN2841769.1 manganese efflux pump [Sedimentisphaerales bacterium]